MEPALKVGNKRPATDSSFDERMCIICQLPAKSKKLSSLGEDGCDKLLKAASDRWERRDYDNVGILQIAIGRPQTVIAGKESQIPQILLFKFYICIPHSYVKEKS